MLPAELVTAVKKTGAGLGASLFATLLAGFDALLYRLTGQTDLVVGIPAAGQNADEGASTAIDLGSFTDQGANDAAWTVDVDWGDGSTHTTFPTSSAGAIGSKNHTYADGPDDHTVTVKVTDKDTDSGTATFNAHVNNVAPTVTLNAGNDQTVNEGTTHTYTYSISDPGSDAVTFPQQTEQYMFRADVRMVERLGFFGCQSENLLDTRCVRDIANHFLIRSRADLLLDLHADGLQIQSELLENVHRDTLPQLDQSE